MIESQPGLEVCGDAVNGRDTVTKTAELKPDLVILDFAMPQLNGLNAASAIKTFLPNVPIIMFTMYSSVVMQEAEKSGITRLIDKAKSNDLVQQSRNCLGRKNLNRGTKAMSFFNSCSRASIPDRTGIRFSPNSLSTASYVSSLVGWSSTSKMFIFSFNSAGLEVARIEVSRRKPQGGRLWPCSAKRH